MPLNLQRGDLWLTTLLEIEMPTRANDAPTGNFVAAHDGLKLHVRCHGRRSSRALPVVCLPGLARTTADFDELAAALSGKDRWVVAIDYRGRGQSEYDRNPDNYSLPVELADLLAVL